MRVKPTRAASGGMKLRTRLMQVLGCVAIASAALQADRLQQPERPAAVATNIGTRTAPANAPATQAAVDLLAPGLSTVVVIVRRNDTLDRIFRQLELNLTDLANLRAVAGTRALLDRLMPGETLRLQHRDGELVGLQRNISLTEQLKVTRSGEEFHADVVARPLELRAQLAHGVIDSSLFDAGSSAGLQDQTVMQLAKIFGWDIDFALDLRSGDEFTVSYQRIFQDGKYLQDGAILAASFVNNGREVRAVRYVAPDGSAGYYSPDGHSMQKAFLRAPLEFRRVSSRFSTARFHPILNRIRAHEGVDYAAATGTPVYASGEGRVRFRGVRGGYGNLLEIDHGAGIVTVYGHLSRFAAAARAGARVRQGQTVAYVGMTGLATGPHLHYEYRLNGRYLDPQRVKLPDATPVAAALLADFRLQSAARLSALNPPVAPALAARPAAPPGALPTLPALPAAR
jgi:murein DD-endopeptidase MepM/ murein hydrolase activator NlpD